MKELELKFVELENKYNLSIEIKEYEIKELKYDEFINIGEAKENEINDLKLKCDELEKNHNI
jgi:hypothetical protein